jgi:hypothetical protein
MRVHSASPTHRLQRCVLQLAVFAFVAQVFLTSAHIHIDEEGWVDLPLGQISTTGPAAHLHAHHHAPIPAGGPAHAPAGHHDSKRPDCQICQSVPVVSASLATAPVEVPRPSPQLTIGPIASSDQIAITEPFSPLQPRAPPALG